MEKISTKFRKRLKITLIILCSFFCLSFLTFWADCSLTEHGKKPAFSVPYLHANDGGTTCYLGLGYQIIKWHTFADQKGNFKVGVEKHYLFGIRLQPNKPTIQLEVENQS